MGCKGSLVRIQSTRRTIIPQRKLWDLFLWQLPGLARVSGH